MANTTVNVNQGDFGADATLAFTLVDPDGTITSLSGRSIYLLVYSDPGATPLLNVACAFDTGMTFHYVPQSTDFALSGCYYYEIEIDGVATGRLSGSRGVFNILPSPHH